ncbi:lipB [Wigglesworthia glossinidia endosymbiont of Glossina brevipalpis]|uniref:Octanoyltransferase n=1 Tax=Wigglesworthia glossinidia brevipalpis TaxID=36870 RepID=LIPB_WIGBR|nr:RecName: Full=Octanoyltransferase; AltName: Full=Lipoate-protein ligase B; AltName: Full=Lipoyl/octanoyl transferase; AltName: Full=Octanoyl-[acyl-carrier-protein]-protein N-octanoyltransferase [Wigglesworthia glossinidia endosymbiont of Glossina brevipalpis]BAC24321.1 lipB [Wigglesworthia glossinidia endosymbiont of Glossina brevipalpis]
MNKVNFRILGLQKYQDIYYIMQKFITCLKKNNINEIWLLEHYPVFTQGNSDNFNKKYIFNIPVVKTDRGGHMTFHGPGQKIIYFLLNIKNLNIKISKLIFYLENIIISTLSYFKINSYSIKNSPGVYVDKKKICSIGLRIKDGYSLHGLALNVDMDLYPFSHIHPCGDKNIKMTQIRDLISNINLEKLNTQIINNCKKFLMMNNFEINFLNSIKIF